MTRKERGERIVAAIKILYDSYQSHLQYAYGGEKSHRAVGESLSFHRKCSLDYLKAMKKLTECL